MLRHVHWPFVCASVANSRTNERHRVVDMHRQTRQRKFEFVFLSVCRLIRSTRPFILFAVADDRRTMVVRELFHLFAFRNFLLSICAVWIRMQSLDYFDSRVEEWEGGRLCVLLLKPFDVWEARAIERARQRWYMVVDGFEIAACSLLYGGNDVYNFLFFDKNNDEKLFLIISVFCLLTLWASRPFPALTRQQNWCTFSTSFLPVSTDYHRLVSEFIYLYSHFKRNVDWNLFYFCKYFLRGTIRCASRFWETVTIAFVERQSSGPITRLSASTWDWPWSTPSSEFYTSIRYPPLRYIYRPRASITRVGRLI